MQCVIVKNWNLPKSKKLVNSLALLARDKFMPKMNFKTTWIYIYYLLIICKKQIKMTRKRIYLAKRYIYQNELDKACLQHDMVYADFKDLTRRTTSDKILPDKAFNIAKNLKYDGCQRGLASIVYKCFDKKNFWYWY